MSVEYIVQYVPIEASKTKGHHGYGNHDKGYNHLPPIDPTTGKRILYGNGCGDGVNVDCFNCTKPKCNWQPSHRKDKPI